MENENQRLQLDEEEIDKNKCNSYITDSDTSASHRYELTSAMKEKLLELPDVVDFIVQLQKYIERQRRKIRKLKLKLKKEGSKDVSTQTEDVDSVSDTGNILDEIKQAAEIAVKNTGFVYEETSGLYYDYNTGYYYNAEYGLYYDGNTGTYMTYDAEKQTYEFHSQVEVTEPTSENKYANTKRKLDQGKIQECKRRKSKSESDGDLEEGECSDDSLKYKSGSSDDGYDNSSDISKQWPPCIRIMVEETGIWEMKLGSLYVITCEGGTIGREGKHDILIPDINVSKHHLKFVFDRDTNKYLVTDLGSRNGTILNGKRMSPSKQESEALDVVHGSRIQIGSTVLLCHIHSGSQTCGLCEPGLIQTYNDKLPVSNQTNRNVQHKEQLKKLKKKFGINQTDNSNANVASTYTDRAQVRRDTVGSQNEHEKTQVASLDQSISSENKGFKLLSKMGWSEGQSLGKEGKGMLEPIKPTSNPGTSGMGSNEVFPINVNTQGNKGKQNIWSKTQERYKQLQPTVEDIFDNSD